MESATLITQDTDTEELTIPEGYPASEEYVLAGILPSNRSHLVMAISQLEPHTHFLDPNRRLLFEIMVRFYERAGEVVSLAMLVKIMESSPWEPSKKLALEETYKALSARVVPPGEFRWSLYQVRQDVAKRQTGEAIAESMNILEYGKEIKGEQLLGHEAARTYLMTRVHEIETAGAQEQMPEGDMRKDGAAMLQAYADRQAGKTGAGVKVGLAAIDEPTGGFQNGELILVCAYTGQGKSQVVTQMAWEVAYGQAQNGAHGQDVFFGTSETIRHQVMRRIYARHSRLPQFEMPEGINSSDIKNATLTPQGEKVLKAVVHDIKSNPNYGQLFLAQMPMDATIGYFDMKLRESGRKAEYALAISDYFGLLRPNVRRASRREEFDEIINDAKHIATQFMNGRGIPLVSPWSVNQTKYMEAMKTHSYGLASLSETSVAEKSADTIIAWLREAENTTEAWLQFLKLRDGELPNIKTMSIDFRTTYIADRLATGAYGAVSASSGFGGSSMDGLEGLI
jgi:replicative DNA helicase